MEQNDRAVRKFGLIGSYLWSDGPRNLRLIMKDLKKVNGCNESRMLCTNSENDWRNWVKQDGGIKVPKWEMECLREQFLMVEERQVIKLTTTFAASYNWTQWERILYRKSELLTDQESDGLFYGYWTYQEGYKIWRNTLSQVAIVSFPTFLPPFHPFFLLFTCLLFLFNRLEVLSIVVENNGKWEHVCPHCEMAKASTY